MNLGFVRSTTGLDKYDFDHIIPVASGGTHHVMNLFILDPGVNKWFGSDPSRQEDKMKLVGGAVKLCDVTFKTPPV